MTKLDLQKIFVAWGQAQRHLPENNQALKNLALANLFPAQSKPILGKRRTPWLSLTFASLAILIFTANSLDRFSPSMTTLQESQRSPKTMIWPAPNSGLPISDTREFIKTNYHATLRTRKIEDLTSKIQTIVRGFGGRVDASSSSKNSGYISFAVPANRLEIFKIEVRELVGDRFYSEQLNTQNLLPEKQLIEQRQSETEKVLSSLETQKKELEANHSKTVNTIQTGLNSIAKELKSLKSESTDDPNRKAQIEARINQLNYEDKNLRSQLSTKNQSYQTNLQSLNSQIQSYESELENIKKQDQGLLDNVATVSGTISFNWISVWKIIDLYVPGNPAAWALLIAALISYLVNRRKYQILIP